MVLFILLLSFSSSFVFGNLKEDLNEILLPRYHYFCPPWINDPNGPVCWNGIYHLFSQYNPNAAQWGDMHWAHAYSKDLVYWYRLPIALSPDESYNNGGVFSGSATITKDGVVLLYTGQTSTEQQCVAYPSSSDDLLLTNWTNFQGNPILEPPLGGLNGFRDPTTAWEDASGNYFILVGSGYASGGGAVLLFNSTNLTQWNYMKPFYVVNDTNPLTCECPDFYQLPSSPDFWALKYSVYGRDWWRLGTYDISTQSYDEISYGLYDYGGSYYASKTFFDSPNNRQILWGWLQELDGPAQWALRGWAGAYNVPRVVTMVNNRLSFNPIPELQVLRGDVFHLDHVHVDVSSKEDMPLKSRQFEVYTEISFTNSSSFGINVLESPDDHLEVTYVFISPPSGPLINTDMPGMDYRGFTLNDPNYTLCEEACMEDVLCFAWTYTVPGMKGPTASCFLKSSVPKTNPNIQCISGSKGHFGVNRTLSSLSNDANPGFSPQSLFFPWIEPTQDQHINLRILVDHSIIEVYANNGSSVLTTRVYPTLLESTSLSISSEGGTTNFASFDFWEMGSIWPDAGFN